MTSALHGVTVEYPNGERGLIDATVVFADNASTALVGPSGSGKSTLLHAMCGLAPIAQGYVSIAGTDVKKGDAATFSRLRRESLGIVFQQGLLLPDISCLDNVALPLRLRGSSRKAARAAASDVLLDLHLGEFGRRMPWTLSGGQRQRVAVARAICQEPTLILADEPTGALDTKNSQLTIDLLLRAAKRCQATLIVVTHDLAIAQQCDTLIHVSDGRIASEGL